MAIFRSMTYGVNRIVKLADGSSAKIEIMATADCEGPKSPYSEFFELSQFVESRMAEALEELLGSPIVPVAE